MSGLPLKTKSKTLKWTLEAEEALQSIKEILISSPILASLNSEHVFIIHTDASDVAIAGVLTEKVEGQERVVESKKLTIPK